MRLVTGSRRDLNRGTRRTVNDGVPTSSTVVVLSLIPLDPDSSMDNQQSGEQLRVVFRSGWRVLQGTKISKKRCTSEQKAIEYRDRVLRGLSRFEPVDDKAVRDAEAAIRGFAP